MGAGSEKTKRPRVRLGNHPHLKIQLYSTQGIKLDTLTPVLEILFGRFLLGYQDPCWDGAAADAAARGLRRSCCLPPRAVRRHPLFLLRTWPHPYPASNVGVVVSRYPRVYRPCWPISSDGRTAHGPFFLRALPPRWGHLPGHVPRAGPAPGAARRYAGISWRRRWGGIPVLLAENRRLGAGPCCASGRIFSYGLLFMHWRSGLPSLPAQSGSAGGTGRLSTCWLPGAGGIPPCVLSPGTGR